MPPTAKTSPQQHRRRWHVTGQVQGVGFRPFVYRLAQRCGVRGYVRNDTEGVTIEAQGSAAQLKRFSRALDSERPPLASVDSVVAHDIPVAYQDADGRFVICASEDRPDGQAPPVRVGVTADSALCPACLEDITDQANRRHRYGLTNCTDCGPRYTIIDDVPYDRPNTTMRDFVMCDDCRAEYTDPSDRRYHAQPIACHTCGPKLELVDPQGVPLPGDPIKAVAALLARGGVVAVKGLGGFHLASRADNERVVTRLRRGKRRDGKPFALMCRSVEAARKYVRISGQAESALCSPAAPIVLATRKPGAAVAPSVAPDTHRLGVMLPYTPIHHLLFAELATDIDALVMTSANPSDEPLTIDNDEALRRLSGLCDAILRHDRPIRRRVDDSVVLDIAGNKPLPIRRARGYVPTAIELPVGNDAHGLCVGGELKNTFALVRDRRAILSQHLGDLRHTPNYDHFRESIEDLVKLFDVKPKWIAHDLHPRYLGTAHAGALAALWGVPLIGVQHHHAHAAAVMAEHGITEPVLAVVCDGVGYGEDGTSWGGELLLADLASYRRLAHLRPIELIGGDAAAVDTRRCGLALLSQTFGEHFHSHPAASLLIRDVNERQMLSAMLSRGVNCATSTALGRYFDGVAALLGLSERNAYEAQAAMRLESAAHRSTGGIARGPLFRTLPGDPQVIDLSPLIGALVAGRAHQKPAEDLSALFHDQLAWAWAEAVKGASARLGVTTVVLSGGVFCNERLTRCLTDRLVGVHSARDAGGGLRVLTHTKVPANDGGLSLGQAVVAAARYGKAGA